MDILEILEKLVIVNPNDLELGKKVREMYYNLKNNQDGVQQKSLNDVLTEVWGKIDKLRSEGKTEDEIIKYINKNK